MLENSKEKKFGEWYLEAVQSSKLMDYSPVQGCMVFREDSYAIWEAIQKSFDEKIKRTGHKNVYFPLFIPESFLTREKEHFRGFQAEVAWVTHGGNEKLGERLAVRPTSETIIYSSYSKWVKSYRDLPLLLNQWCPVVRWDTKTLKPFLRTREFLWQEGHTVHASKKEADEEVMMILDFYREVCENELAVPVIPGRKSEAEKFPGALYTTAIEGMMPDGKALQCGTSHNLGQNFAKMFDIKFKDKEEKDELAWQTSWGMSTRLIGALVMVHGDDKGLVLPPRIAPTQIVVIPIPSKSGDSSKVLNACKELAAGLREIGLRVFLDDRDDKTPGWKFNEWELRGVPLRIELGERDLAKNEVVLVRRDEQVKKSVKQDEIAEECLKLLDEIQKNLFQKAKQKMVELTTDAKDFKHLSEVMEKKGGFVKAWWCENPYCEEKIKKETGATIRVIPFKQEKHSSECVVCGKEGKVRACFARSY